MNLGLKPLNQPFRTPGHCKKFAIYVKDPKTGKVRIVRFNYSPKPDKGE